MSQIAADARQVEVLRSLVTNFGEVESRERALALLESRPGFLKWYRRHYGFPLNSQLTITRRAYRDGAERHIASAAEAAGIAKQPMLLCSLAGVSEATLEAALLEAPTAPPLLLVSMPLAPMNFVLHWDEHLVFTFSSQLWARLRMSETNWGAL